MLGPAVEEIRIRPPARESPLEGCSLLGWAAGGTAVASGRLGLRPAVGAVAREARVAGALAVAVRYTVCRTRTPVLRWRESWAAGGTTVVRKVGGWRLAREASDGAAAGWRGKRATERLVS
jgi:hypothetical protein